RIERLRQLKEEGKGATGLRDSSLQARTRRTQLKQYRTALNHLALLYQGKHPQLTLEEARASSEREAGRLHLEHKLDTGAIGNEKEYAGLGDKAINEHVWQQWRDGRLEQLTQEVERAKRAGEKEMNIRLRVCPEDAT